MSSQIATLAAWALPPISLEEIGEASEERLIRSCVPLAIKIAKAFAAAGRGEIDDNLSSAVHGLTVAAKRFDRKRGVRFSTYAATYISGYISRAFRQTMSIDGGRLKKASEYSLESLADSSEPPDFEDGFSDDRLTRILRGLSTVERKALLRYSQGPIGREEQATYQQAVKAIRQARILGAMISNS